MVFERVAVAADDAADNDERDKGPCGAAEQQGFTADFVEGQGAGRAERVFTMP